jgi:ABC-2 type transport system ATP-binding protein
MIQVRNLVKRYGVVTALDDLSFDVRRGEILALLGPNGAGKTTFVRVLTTMLRPTGGTIEIDGIDVRSKPHDVRKRLGVLFQESSLDEEMTACENLEFHAVLHGLARERRQERIEQVLSEAGLWDRRHDFVRHFSGGMRRRLEVARALLQMPRVLALDEPTVGLDPQTRDHLWTRVQELNRRNELTVLLTTHYLEEAERVADRVLVIDHGRVVGLGRSDELKALTRTDTLTQAFVALTGAGMRE